MKNKTPTKINNRLITPTSIGSPSVPASITHFNTLAANAQPPTSRNSMSAPNDKFENFMTRLEKKLDDFITDNQNTTRTITTQYNPTLSHLIQLQLNQAKYNLTQLNQPNRALQEHPKLFYKKTNKVNATK